MQGYISALNFIDQTGAVTLVDSDQHYNFSTKALDDPEDFAALAVGLNASFKLIDGRVRDLKPERLVDPDDDRTYQLPDAVSFEPTHLRDGYEILDVGRLQLSKTNRDLGKARAELASLCRALGGNTLLEVSESSELRQFMGYAFIYHTVKGYAASAGRPDERGQANASELQQSINHAEIKRRGLRHTHKAASKLALKLCGALLLLIFCAGYIYAQFV